MVIIKHDITYADAEISEENRTYVIYATRTRCVVIAGPVVDVINNIFIALDAPDELLYAFAHPIVNRLSWMLHGPGVLMDVRDTAKVLKKALRAAKVPRYYRRIVLATFWHHMTAVHLDGEGEVVGPGEGGIPLISGAVAVGLHTFLYESIPGI